MTGEGSTEPPGSGGAGFAGAGAGATVLAIFGPTASGKSAVAEAIAERVPAELVSADSMQVYRGLPILTNQSPAPTRLVGIWPLDHEASVGEFATLAHEAIDEILAAGKLPVVVGGTGLYLRAALVELGLPPAPAEGVRERWSAFYDERGSTAAHAELAARDPAAAATVHPNDRRRIVRALELAESGSSLRPERDRLWAAETRHPTVIVGLDVPKEVVERRIAERTEAMLAAGAAEEALTALAGSISSTARKVIGLEEAATLPRDEAVEAIAARTRRYAAYQRKWMRRIPDLVAVDADRPVNEVADAVLAALRSRSAEPA